ncbi:hypothetical protein SODALDRAFT_325791 [Sodiomyces alkalinus F11]|uniref:Velvet domain-containing protein n=1 Tax=Sodiomyces alkalinus (strain CBS 110278 / VKM F-3762 / F11) TaxID=1314773 RepID=A0A3N2PPU5_SODAK|nr:hypothetical protein SODALDRAFT_325791 [Sodiomyces alkalinus F11]ROT36460.1 hypothetical protein SODALDRAFT_325791 [Sodiomyces alkalinus F11]
MSPIYRRNEVQVHSPSSTLSDSNPQATTSTGDPNYMLSIIQHPVHGRVHNGKDKDRKPIDPPPVVRLQVSPGRDPTGVYLTNPYHFVMCHLIDVGEKDSKGQTIEKPVEGNKLIGTIVSSLHRLKDVQNQDVAYFVFSDVSVKVEGLFKLHFTLYEMAGDDCRQLAGIKSEPFYVYPAKNFPGLAESTFLTRSLSDQGVRVRIRKDSRQSQGMKGNKRFAPSGDDPRKDMPQRRRTDEEGNYRAVGVGASTLSPVQTSPGSGSLQGNIPPSPASSTGMVHTSGGIRPQRPLSSSMGPVMSNMSPRGQVGAGFYGQSSYFQQNMAPGHMLNGSSLAHSPTTISPTSTHSMSMYGPHAGVIPDYYAGYGHINGHPTAAAHAHYSQTPPSA